jgi:CRP-like cAMP-binding protein
METKAFSELFPLFNTANPQTIASILSAVDKHEYPEDRTVLMEDAWGNAVYFIASGWVKVRRLYKADVFTLAIMGPGDFFGEMAILDESPRSTDVIALSTVKLLSISAQDFIQTLFKDSELHHRLLQLMVRRLRQTNLRFQQRHQKPPIKLLNNLITLVENYGEATPNGMEIYNIPYRDLADITDISIEDTASIIGKLQERGWLKIDEVHQSLCITNIQQLSQLVAKAE